MDWSMMNHPGWVRQQEILEAARNDRTRPTLLDVLIVLRVWFSARLRGQAKRAPLAPASACCVAAPDMTTECC